MEFFITTLLLPIIVTAFLIRTILRLDVSSYFSTYEKAATHIKQA